MEGDPEVYGVGNAYTTEFRQLDTRLGRWWSVDPMVAQLPWQSPYTSMDNNPVMFNDPKGDWVKGAGLFRNLFNSDNKINAEDRAKELGGDAIASKDVDEGWNVTYTSNENMTLGDHTNIQLKALNIENFSGKSTGKQIVDLGKKIWDNTDLEFTSTITNGELGFKAKVFNIGLALYDGTGGPFGLEGVNDIVGLRDNKFTLLNDKDAVSNKSFEVGIGIFGFQKSQLILQSSGEIIKETESYTALITIDNVSDNINKEKYQDASFSAFSFKVGLYLIGVDFNLKLKLPKVNDIFD